VLCVDLVQERAAETVALIRAEGGEADAHVADVTRAAECDAMVAAAVERWGGLDILHNNVGVESRRSLMDTTEEEWDRVMAIDLKSMFLATRSAVPHLAARGGGSVICVSSVAALRGHGRTAYSAAKAGVIGFVQSIAVQLGPQGIRVNAIAPGTVWTPLVWDLGEEARVRRREASPLGTEGTGWDVGWGAVYLASDEARWVTGQTLVIDAGLSMTTR
jgi:NAD(P)-dependent dehydrogenase (short-subunit alcohol dehydrogenase family)